MIKVHQHAVINQMLYKKKKLRPNDVPVRPTEKVSRTSATSGKNESRALLFKLRVCSVNRMWLETDWAPENNPHIFLLLISHNQYSLHPEQLILIRWLCLEITSYLITLTFNSLGSVVFLFWKEINTLIKQGHIKLIKSGSIYNLMKISISNQCCFWTFNSPKNPRKKISRFPKNIYIKQQNCYW